ncbi:MAG: glucose-1-phosphate adenylyltransferase [Dethiobacter sp.]|jgi:glucose-1-phosphate adenylyltransferase|nr:MAG: glucose-1-phosphate adenylyltransferase [Dethiobacter sp.]
MNRKKECVAMLLAGGEGKRLGFLTRETAKPAIPFGGKYRIIDFTLSNCTNSGIVDTVGALTQYKPLILNSHIGNGSPWDLDRKKGGISLLPPFVRGKGGKWYKGTADAVFQNMNFLEQYNPRYVLIISGDHIYKMDYSLLLDYHKSKEAEVTIAVIEVPWEETSRFGILNMAEDGRITEFQEKPKNPKNNLASMGIYLFDFDILKKYLQKDQKYPKSSNDFGKDVLPLMLKNKCRMFAYPFRGYWKDVGTIESLWETNMDLLQDKPTLDLYERNWRIYTVSSNQPPHYLGPAAKVEQSMVSDGCLVFGEVNRSVLFPGVYVGENTIIRDSLIMSNVKIGSNVKIIRAIIAENSIVGNGSQICCQDNEAGEIILIKENSTIPDNSIINSTDNLKKVIFESGGKFT